LGCRPRPTTMRGSWRTHICVISSTVLAILTSKS
jgi:hypothetical protein